MPARESSSHGRRDPRCRRRKFASRETLWVVTLAEAHRNRTCLRQQNHLTPILKIGDHASQPRASDLELVACIRILGKPRRRLVADRRASLTYLLHRVTSRLKPWTRRPALQRTSVER